MAEFAPTPIVAVRSQSRRERPDWLATEEPMELRVAGPGQPPMSVSVTMRTPDHDFELAAGFLYTEGLIGPDDIRTIRHCTNDGALDLDHRNIVTVELRRPIDPARLTRRFAATAACGLCGKATLDDLVIRCEPVGEGPTIASSSLITLPERLHDDQQVFVRTGGLHAAALFDPTGGALVIREDVGRHNAVDKVIGHTLLKDASVLRDHVLPNHVLMVSGRLGFEIVQKAAVAGIPIVAAVSAPSTLAVETAQRFGITLVGFLRGDNFNIYSHAQRVTFDA